MCIAGERPPVPDKIIFSLKDLMTRSWHGDPKVRSDFPHIVKELECIIVDAAISDPLGRQFWKENFIDEDAVSNPRETIPWEEFLVLFHQFLESDPVPLLDNASPDVLLSATPAQLKEFSSRSKENYNRVMEAFEMHGQNLSDLDIEADKLTEIVEWRCLKEVLVEEAKFKDGTELVRMESFGDVLAWFGPLRIDKKGSVQGEFLQNIRQIMESGYFFGPLSGRAAIMHLKDKKPGKLSFYCTQLLFPF